MGDDLCLPVVSQLSLPSLLLLLGFCEGPNWSRGCCEGLPEDFGVTGMGSWDPDWRSMVTKWLSCLVAEASPRASADAVTLFFVSLDIISKSYGRSC